MHMTMTLPRHMPESASTRPRETYTNTLTPITPITLITPYILYILLYIIVYICIYLMHKSKITRYTCVCMEVTRSYGM